MIRNAISAIEMGFKRPRVRISTLGPKRPEQQLLFWPFYFAMSRESNSLNRHMPVACGWHQCKHWGANRALPGQIQRGARVAAVKISWVNNEKEILGTATGVYISCRPFPDGNANESRHFTSMSYNPSVKNHRFLPAPFAQGSLFSL